jgi:hypothetical protein
MRPQLWRACLPTESGRTYFPRSPNVTSQDFQGCARKFPLDGINGFRLLRECLRILRVPHASRHSGCLERWKTMHVHLCSPHQGNPSWFRALARRHCRRRLRRGLSNRLVTRSHRAILRRARIRRDPCLSEERCTSLFKGIFLHWLGLAHLGLLISSSFILMPAPILAVHLFEIRGRRGLAIGPRDQIVSYCAQPISITAGRTDRSDLLSETARQKVPYF